MVKAEAALLFNINGTLINLLTITFLSRTLLLYQEGQCVIFGIYFKKFNLQLKVQEMCISTPGLLKKELRIRV